MVQGTTSDAGKSIMVAGLCRVFQRRGLSVAPFKPQNMALNSAVTPDGGEIGRAQALQAQAAKVPLSVHMNPVLLKPNTDTGAQVILQGHSIGNIEALDYHEYKPKAAKSVFDSFEKLSQEYKNILIEGAGSPAEINLRKGDIANMGFALPTQTPVIIIADIENIKSGREDKFKVIIPRLPHISNHTDFEPLRLHPELDVEYLSHLEAIPPADLIILPGSKNVGFDLNWLRSQGWEEAINKHLRYGGKVIGICGGLQMLGTSIDDPLGIEGEVKSHQGFALLDYSTVLQAEKKLTNESGKLSFTDASVQGYEIHAGISEGKALNNPAVILDGKADGAISEDNQIFVTYLHGFFDSSDALNAILKWAGTNTTQNFDVNEQREQQLNRLADAIEESMDVEQLIGITQQA
ncbi:UNVERIFIED_CONTAM: hypothetical protein GTU68_022746 [Idotea baltica]|nr:hypothetical protein [Idotea baltica]